MKSNKDTMEAGKWNNVLQASPNIGSSIEHANILMIHHRLSRSISSFI